MDKNLLSDKPVENKDQDRFRRYEFSKRIAQSILERRNADCLVIGIYGMWGEGKSSILNFIEQELIDDNVLTIRFNPWRYSNEESLLKYFLKKIAETLGKKLYTKTEQVNDVLSKFGGFIGQLTKLVTSEKIDLDTEGIGKTIEDIDLEILKERINAYIINSEKKITIFIDDIDRLDKNEIYSLLRLVKLTCDFSNTTYILSFDEKMVASAIGERFGEGNQKAGYNFLEKIIQIPLKIPAAQTSDLERYCLKLVNDSLQTGTIVLKEEDNLRFGREFFNNILLRLNTPRLAIRYSNCLSFSLPLLKGEVNIVDLMLLEAIKVFYPIYYDFIKENPNYFVFPSTNQTLTKDWERKAKDLKDNLEKISQDLSNREKKAIENLLEELFPTMKKMFSNNIISEWDYIHWHKEKRIVSPNYFNKYFSYSSLEGDVPNITFESFVLSIQDISENELLEDIKKILSETGENVFLHKMRLLEDDLDWESSKKLIRVLCKNSALFTGNNNYSFLFQSPRTQSIIFICKLLFMSNDNIEKFQLAKEIMQEPIAFAYAFDINNNFRSAHEDDKFTNNEYIELAEILIERAIKEAGQQTIFEKFPNYARYLLGAWSEKNPKEVVDYIRNAIDSSPKKCLELLNAMSPIASTNGPEFYKATFGQQYYDYLKRIIDTSYVHEKIIEAFGFELAQDTQPLIWDEFEALTGLNVLRQFEHWYAKDIT